MKRFFNILKTRDLPSFSALLYFLDCKTLFLFVFSLSCYLVFVCSFQGTTRDCSLSGVGSSCLIRLGGDKGGRTPDLLLAGQALSQLSYAPGLNVHFRTQVLKIE